MPRRSFLWAFALVLSIAAFLRFWHLVDQGFTEYDEGWLIDVAQRSAQEWREGDLRSYNDFKSSHTTWALLTLSFLLSGVSSISIQLPFALGGVLSVAVLMWLSNQMFGRRTALVCGLLVATSPMHVMYSRTVGIEATGMLFLFSSYALVSLASRSGRWSAFLASSFGAGLAMGLAATANYRAMVCLPVPLLTLVLLVRPARRLGLALLSYLVGLAATFLAWDRSLLAAFPDSGGYFRALLERDESVLRYSFRGVSSVLERFRLEEPLFYVKSMWDLGNRSLLVLFGLWVLLLLAGVVLRLNRRGSATGRHDLVLLVLTVVPAAGFTAIVFKAPRAFSFVEPLLALAAARVLVLAWEAGAGTGSGKRLLRSAAAVGLLSSVALGLGRSLTEDVIGRSNGFRRAFTELGGTEEGVIVVLDRLVPSFYATETGRRATVLGMGSTLGDLVLRSREGYRYFLLDGQFSVFQSFFTYVWPVLEPLEPDVRIPAPNYIRLAHFVEHTVHMATSYDDQVKRYRWWTGRWGRNLPAYDLESVVRPLEWRGAGGRWYRVGSGIVAMKDDSVDSALHEIVLDDRRNGDTVTARLLFDYNRLPVEGGLVVSEAVDPEARQPSGVVFFWKLGRESSSGFLARIEHGKVAERLAESSTLTVTPESRLSISWKDAVVRAEVDGQPVLTARASGPARPSSGGFLAGAGQSLELRDFTIGSSAGASTER